MNIEAENKKIYVMDGKYGKMYSTSVSRHKQDDTWQTSYINLYFPDGAEIEDGEIINFKGYLVPTNDSHKVAMRVLEFTRKEKSVDSVKLEDIDTDDDLPF